MTILLHANTLHLRGICVAVCKNGWGYVLLKLWLVHTSAQNYVTCERLRTTVQPSKGVIPGTLQTHVNFSCKNTSLIYNEQSKTPFGYTPGALAASNVFTKANAESKHFSQGPKCRKKCLHTSSCCGIIGTTGNHLQYA